MIGMKSIQLAACLFAGFALCPGSARGQAPAVGNHAEASPHTSGDAHASMEVMQIPSHGVQVNAIAYVAAGAGPHPLVVLLHGFPGYERNLDLAQDMRRAGWDVVYFDYRGSWGSPGSFSFSHSMEDVVAVLAYLRQPANVQRLRFDPSRIVLVGHSVGGFMALQTAAGDPGVKGLAMISAADLGGGFEQLLSHESRPKAVHDVSARFDQQSMAPLVGCTPDGLARELAEHASAWAFQSKAAALMDRPTLVLTADDGFAGLDDAFAGALRQAGDARVSTAHFATDHAYSDKRTELSGALLQWLAPLAK